MTSLQLVPGRRMALLCLVVVLPLVAARAQQRPSEQPSPWTNEQEALRAAEQAELPRLLRHYRALTLDASTLRATLTTAPPEGAASRAAQPAVLTLPLPDGKWGRFRIVEAPVMAPELAAQFPQIKTYAGIGLDDPTALLRCDFTPQGFHAQVLSATSGDFFIDPVSPTDVTHYVAYFKRDMNYAARGPRPVCTVEPAPAPAAHDPAARPTSTATSSNVQVSAGSVLRTYRLAVAATGEYTAARGGTVASALSAITTSVNRVTGVYEKELAVRLQLVANNNLIIFTDGATDPYTNNNPTALLSQNQTTLNSLIGSANYDIGHVFSTAGGGIATLRSVCNATVKAQGETGTPNPVGDAFDIDYVAHEMGHQFGGNHPFNGTQLNCSSSNRNPATAWEPGSGSTIMAYAGICGTDDLQPHSDAYFHSGNFEEMQAFINLATCRTTATTGNTPPTVTMPAARTLPKSTPFQLTATGADANGDVLTYCWEEIDLGPAGPPKPTTQVANQTPPLFRSWPPSTSRTRYFPRLNELRLNTTVKGETLPTVARTMKFRCTVRDQHLSTLGRVVGGVTTSPLVTLTVSGTAGPFTVTAPNTSTVVWRVGTTATVTWSVAGTNVAPVSCANVRILLSRDGGLTYPTVLLNSTPNDGSQVITVPNTPTTQARVMVAAADNYFFDISNANFSIVSATAGRGIVANVQPDSGATCEARPMSYLVSVVPLAGFNDSVRLSVTGLPPGATARFVKPWLLPPDTTWLHVSVSDSTPAATYSLAITATGGAQVQTQTVELVVQPTLSARVLPQFPPNYAPGQGTRPRFEWLPVPGATGYQIELATDARFTPPVLLSQGGLTEPFFQSRNMELDTTLNYYWRITATNGCDSSDASVTFTFGPGSVGLLNPEQHVALNVVPNPSASGEFTLSLAGHVAGPLRLTVVDALGRVVLRDEWVATSAPDRPVNLRTQSPGVYGLRLVLPDGRVATRRLLRL